MDKDRHWYRHHEMQGPEPVLAPDKRLVILTQLTLHPKPPITWCQPQHLPYILAARIRLDLRISAQ